MNQDLIAQVHVEQGWGWAAFWEEVHKHGFLKEKIWFFGKDVWPRVYGDSKTELMKSRNHEKPGAGKRTQQRAAVELPRGRGQGGREAQRHAEPPCVQTNAWELADHGGRQEGPFGCPRNHSAGGAGLCLPELHVPLCGRARFCPRNWKSLGLRKESDHAGWLKRAAF